MPYPNLSPSISVICPAYNSARFILAALNSIIKQTLQATEIIVIDDGSTDNTSEIVNSLDHPNIHYIHQPNRGVSNARNLGLTLASGDFIAFLDADDLWHDDYLKKQSALLDSNSALVCANANFARFDNATGEMTTQQFSYYPELKHLTMHTGPIPNTSMLMGDSFARLVNFCEIPAFTQAMMFRRNLIGELRFDEHLRICEDMHFALQAFLRGSVAFNWEVLVSVRRHETNATRDHRQIAVHKLEALRRFNTRELDQPQLAAFASRFVRAHIEAARLLADEGDFSSAISLIRDMRKIKGDEVRKIKGLIRVTQDILMKTIRPPAN